MKPAGFFVFNLGFHKVDPTSKRNISRRLIPRGETDLVLPEGRRIGVLGVNKEEVQSTFQYCGSEYRVIDDVPTSELEMFFFVICHGRNEFDSSAVTGVKSRVSIFSRHSGSQHFATSGLWLADKSSEVLTPKLSFEHTKRSQLRITFAGEYPEIELV